jgi:hypothetical protein
VWPEPRKEHGQSCRLTGRDQGSPDHPRTAFALVAATVLLVCGISVLANGRILAGGAVAFLGAFMLLGTSALVRGGNAGTIAMLLALPVIGLRSIVLSIIDVSLIGLTLGGFLLAGGSWSSGDGVVTGRVDASAHPGGKGRQLERGEARSSGRPD